MINDFKSLFFKNYIEKQNNLVVGLSGGPDSTFLLYYIKHLQEYFGYVGNVITIIVDHGLRSESYHEALETKKMSLKLGFDTKVIKIKDKYTSGNLQNWARLRRRNILYQFAQKYSANIILGHHYDDQIETIYMRLIRSSGFDGLIGIKKITNWNEVKVLRPLLGVKKKEILNFLTSKKISYISDKSNLNLKFERVKSRKILRLLEKNKFCNIQNKLYKLSTISKRFVKCFNKFEKVWRNQNVTYYSYGSISIYYENFLLLFKKHDILSSYILGKLIKNVGGNDFLPNKLKLINNLKNIVQEKYDKFTINNVLVFRKSKYLNLIRENRNIKFEQKIFKNILNFFDNKFIVLSKFNGILIPNHDNENFIFDLNNIELMSKSYKYINCTIPKLKTLEGRIINPYLYSIEEIKINNHLKRKSEFDLIFIKGKN